MTKPPLIAVCEDDADIRELLAAFLAANGFQVRTARDAVMLELLLKEETIALIILDWMLPGEDGLSACRRIRAAGGPPVIMLTAKDEDADRITGLNGGADDYVAKPFNPQVLLARIRAVLRRGAPPADGERFILADILIDRDARRVQIAGGAELVLTAAEFDLLLCFVQSPQRVLSRDQLLDKTRGRASDLFDRSIDMQVSRLRRRLEDGGSEAASLIRTVRNAGYILGASVRKE